MIAQDLIHEYQSKWKHIQKTMHETGADGCLLSMGVNIFYTTGVMYNGYFYLPAEGDPLFFVKRPNGLDGKQTIYIRKPEQIPVFLQERGYSLPKRIMLEAGELPFSDYTRLLKIFNLTEAGDATSMLRLIRRVKTPWEIEQTRLCARQHEAVYEEIPSCFRMGMTDLEFQFEIEHRMRLHGSMGVFRTFGLNMDIFMGSLLAGENAETPSPYDFALGGGGMNKSCPLGANGTLLKEGMAVMIDMAGNYTPYMTDMTRVFSIGKLPDQAYHAHEVSYKIQQVLEQMIKPGVSCAEVYNKAIQIVKEEGLEDYFMGTKQQAKFVGHGIGLQINELPVFTPRSKEILEENMIFALEPKFVLPGIGAVGIENSFAVTDNGCEKLTIYPEEIINLL